MQTWLDRFRRVHGNRYDYSMMIFQNARTPIRIVCAEHGPFDQLPQYHVKGRGCPRCATQKRRLGTSEWVVRAKALHGDRYDYSRSEYHRNDKPIRIGCPRHGDFSQTPSNHLQGRGCPHCASERIRTSPEQWRLRIEQFKQIHKNKYEYDIDSFSAMNRKARIRCPIHGWFEQTPNNHLSGRGCDACGGTKTKDRDEFIAQAHAVHKNRFDYSRVDYRRGTSPVTIICPEHGEFQQTPRNHVNLKRGCWLCAGTAPSNTSEFAKKSHLMHGGQYDYTAVSYVRSGDRVDIVCPKHGPFSQTPENHLAGNGCPRCAGSKSKAEQELFDFVRELHPTAISRDRTKIGPYELDILLPNLNLAIEFCGLYWHSKLPRNYHLDKHLRCAAAGLRLITILEDEWRFHRTKVEATLRHFLGESPKGVYARQCVIREIEPRTAKEFLNRYHLLGAGSTHRHLIGAFHKDVLIACMTFRYPNRERAGSEQIEMTRFVTDGRNHPGLGSKMFAWAVNQYGFNRVVAFVDRRWFTGIFKSISGFKQVGVSPPTLFWTKGNRRFHRRFMTKKKAQSDGTLLPGETKLDMMTRLGYSRIYDCGKLKLEWRAQS